ncbi:MAG: hypothetical protein EBX41_03390, partial [Chitinophagia bacterium]|nr:hypothetical protein [Chitinophagia bacterium]
DRTIRKNFENYNFDNVDAPENKEIITGVIQRANELDKVIKAMISKENVLRKDDEDTGEV